MNLRANEFTRKSIFIQNKKHSIISVLNKADAKTVEEKYNSYERFIDLNMSFLEQVYERINEMAEKAKEQMAVKKRLISLERQEKVVKRKLSELRTLLTNKSSQTIIDSKIKQIQAEFNKLDSV